VTLEALIEQIGAGKVASVSWSIQPEIGPGWIGGERSITVRIGDRVLAEGAEALVRLDAALVAREVIPAEPCDSMLSGEGTLRVEDGQLVLDYAWSDTPVYQFGAAGHAAVGLMDV
jgi:hypothetical protein